MRNDVACLHVVSGLADLCVNHPKEVEQFLMCLAGFAIPNPDSCRLSRISPTAVMTAPPYKILEALTGIAFVTIMTRHPWNQHIVACTGEHRMSLWERRTFTAPDQLH